MQEPFLINLYRLTATLELRTLDIAEATIIAAKLAKMDPWQSLGFTSTSLERYLTRVNPGLHRYSVFKEGALSGIVAVRYPWLRGAYLELLGLFAETQGDGFGPHIIAWLISETRMGGSNLWATVSASNSKARRFYEKQGFLPIGDIPDLVQDGCTEILLHLPLKKVVSCNNIHF